MYVHDLSPYVFRIVGNFGVQWYGLSYLMGFFIAYVVILWLVSRQRAGLTVNMVGDFVSYSVVGVLLGGRLGYCVFYAPDLFLKFKDSFPFWGVLALNEGGMSAHGGIIGLILAATLFAMKTGVNRLYLYDLVAITGPLGLLMGRIANFINGELVGRQCPNDFPFAVKFPQDILQWPAHDPSRLSDLSAVIEKMPSDLLQGHTVSDWNSWLSQMTTDSAAYKSVIDTLYAIIHAIQDGRLEIRDTLAIVLTPRYPSQLLEALLEGALLFLIIFFYLRKPRKPGTAGALFVVLYSIFRIGAENFRMPDAHIGYQFLDLTRGQWLSVVMLIIGLVLMFLWSRQGGLTMSGWGRGQSVKLHRR